MSEAYDSAECSKQRTIWATHEALRKFGLNDFDYVTLSWLLGYHTQGMKALRDVMTEQDLQTCEQLRGPNGYFIFKMLEARSGQT